jgi:hypothetical protein
MNRRRCAPHIPLAVRQGTTAAAVESQSQVIETFVTENATRLRAKSPQVISEGRRALISMVLSGDPSTMFLFTYGKIVSQHVGAVADDEQLLTRLNAAIVIGEITERVPDTRMAPVALRFIDDEDTAVAIWGMKSATMMLPRMASQGVLSSKEPLVGAVSAAFIAHPSGPVAGEAYRALTLEYPLPGNQQLTAPQMTAAIPVVVPEILEVLQVRVALAFAGPLEDPWVETMPAGFLTRTQVWQAMTTEQQNQTVALLAGLANATADHVATISGKEQREPLMGLLQKSIGGGFQVIGRDFVKAPRLEQAGKALGLLRSDATAEQLSEATAALNEAVKSAPQFKDVEIPTGVPAEETADESETEQPTDTQPAAE